MLYMISKRLNLQEVGYFPQAEVRVKAASHEAREAFRPPLSIRKETEGLLSRLLRHTGRAILAAGKHSLMRDQMPLLLY